MSNVDRENLGIIVTELAKVGDFLIDNGHFERAIEVFMALSYADPTFEAGFYAYEIGKCYQKLENKEMAKKFFVIASRENPSIFAYDETSGGYKIETNA